MAVLLSVQSLTKAYGARPLFREITLGVDDNEKMGLIGPNGAGKSTLLKLMAGMEKPDAGTVSMRRGLRIAYVSQEENFSGDVTVAQALAAAVESATQDTLERDVQVEVMLGKIGFLDRDQKAESLSGGWRKRLALACALITEPDLLLMDEPTNHLDMEGVLWLEGMLQNARFAFVLISHDRRFLENVVERMVELSPMYAEGFLSVDGAYSDLLTRREEYLSAQSQQQHALAGKVKREIEWLRRGAPARTTKAQGRIQEAERLIESLAEVKYRTEQDKVAGIDFTTSGRKAKELLVAKDVEKSMGGRLLFKGVNLTLGMGTKLGLIGANGSGKTTLLRLLVGDLEQDAGTVKRAKDLRVVWFDQKRVQLDKTRLLRDCLSPNGDFVTYQDQSIHVSGWAKRFLFRSEQLNVPVSALSGGEQARILIANLMLLPADVLILDEPTNDLDIPSLEVLEESLTDFPGVVALVTHDRYLLDAVSTEIIALDGQGGVRSFADFSQWERSQRPAPPTPAKSAAPSASPRPVRQALSTAERREYAGMEALIEAAETELAALQQRMEDPEVVRDHVQLQDCWNRIDPAKEKIAQLYARWEELEAKQAGK